MTWDRIESMARSIDLDEGIKARIADPFWMLGRQWQVGELRGDDAARPVSVSIKAEIAPVGSYRAGPKGSAQHRWPEKDGKPSPPLEAMVEGTQPLANGFSGMAHSARIGQELYHLLTEAKATRVASLLKARFRFEAAPAHMAGTGRARVALRLLQARGIDGRAALTDKDKILETAISALRSAAKRRAARAAFAAMRAAHPVEKESAWDPTRMEYSFSVAAMGASAEVVLTAGEHHGGHLDWYQFDVGGASHGLTREQSQASTLARTVLPTPVRYSGMPAARWWEFEDRQVHMGDVQSGPGDFARLMVAEFATSYSDDWFMVPLRVPRGALVRVLSVEVEDNFGSEATGITHVSANDAAELKEAKAEHDRSFRMFEMSGDPGPEAGIAPWLFIAPTLASSMEGPALERIEMARDEGANLAWAIERTIEGPMGRAFDRGREWFATDEAQSLAAPDTGSQDGTSRYQDMIWRYHLSSDMPPPWWIPFLPEKRADNGDEMWLRRGQMLEWQRLQTDQGGVFGSLLAPRGAPFYVEEEEVPRSGITVRRKYQFCRAEDGSIHLWVQNVKTPGRGERSSGLRWDVLSWRQTGD